jgi:hypothetical protein
MYGGAAGAAAAAARKKKRREREEEEKLTSYKDSDMDGWEFKILRSHTGKFKKREFVEQVCREEAKAGWEMIEKFDNNRIRFKRPVDRRGTDRALEIDPYRTTVGISEGTMVMVVLGAALAAGGLLFLFASLLK